MVIVMIKNDRYFDFTSIDTVENFRDFIAQFNNIYESYTDFKYQNWLGFNSISDEVVNSMRRSMKLEAKRVRPLFAYLTHKLLQKKYFPIDIIKVCIGVETLHNFALIHDDITDLSNLRRGEPTIEEEFRLKVLQKGGEEFNSKHIGLNAAMYAGDILLYTSNFMFSLLNEADIKTIQNVQDVFLQLQTEVFFGQLDDSLGVTEESLQNITVERINNILSLKSGRYSIMQPMILGATLAGLEGEELEKMYKYGEDFGIVFQIKDDLLGLFGDEFEMGKSADSDILEGKRTLLMLKTYQKTNELGKKLIDSTLGNRNASKMDLEQVKQLVISTGVKTEMEQFCRAGADTFIDYLHSIPQTDSHYLTILCELADYIVERKK
jgi:geranylgeranyl diphosphate synthase, type I